MEIKCEYCGSYISEKEEFCSKCGAVNAGFKRSTDGTPKTISELKAWYKAKNLPPMEVTRFFIGENYKNPRAFGIYEENGEYIVYKNKDDGSRAIRYSGSDEAYAVNEIYLKLKSEILNQKAHNINNQKNKKSGKNETSFDKISSIIGLIMAVTFIGGFIISAFFFIKGITETVKDMPYAGNYYSYDYNTYYCNSYVNDDWYWYDYDYDDYVPVTLPSEMYDNIQNYKISEDEEWDSSIERFEDTETGQYVNSLNESSSSDSDSDYSWDSSDSWDSDSSDWDSDW